MRARVIAMLTLAVAIAAPPSYADGVDGIRLRQQHVIVTPDPGSRTLRIVEIAIVQNDGAATAPAPAGFDTGPLPPGQSELVTSYEVPYSGAYVLRKILPIGADAVDVLIEDVGLTAHSRELAGPAGVETAGKRFLRLKARDLAPGSVVAVEIAGELGSAAPTLAAGAGALAPLGLLALGGATAYVLLAPKLRKRRAPGDTAPAEDEELTEEDLLG